MAEVNSMSLEDNSECNDSGILRDTRLKALSYLMCLSVQDGRAQAAQWAINPLDIPTAEIQSKEQCLECLDSFLSTGIWLGYLFNRGDIWYHYFAESVEERYQAPLSLVMSQGGPGDLMLYFRACYRFGYQVISDQEYDILEKLYIGTYPSLTFLTEHTNDNDTYTEVVKAAIKMSGVRGSRDTGPKVINPDSEYASLNAEKSTSIMPVRSYAEVFEFLKNAPDVRIHWSLKVDGFNTKCLFKSDGAGLEVALSRGRASDSWDYTEAVRLIIEKQGIDVSSIKGKVTGETIVDVKALDILRAKYSDKDYKSPKSTAGAMLRAPQSFDPEDYKYLHFYPFDLEGVQKDEAFALFASSGFSAPPAIITDRAEVPLGDLESFQTWLDSTILDPLWEAGKANGIGSDGVVLQLLTDIENDRADKYSDLNIALKFSHWTEAQYESKVKAIIFEQRRVEMSVVLEIEPVTTRDLNVATRVSVGSPAILVKDGVHVGDTIYFSRKSEAINIYLGKVVCGD